MRIVIKDRKSLPRLTVHVDPASPPTVVSAEDGRGPAVSLDWDRALDDEGRLRHCPVCECPAFYVRKQVPRLTVFVLLLAAAVLTSLIYGVGGTGPAMIVLGLLLSVDMLVWMYAARILICYRCESEFHETPIPDRTRPWELTTAERYRPPANPPSPSA